MKIKSEKVMTWVVQVSWMKLIPLYAGEWVGTGGIYQRRIPKSGIL